jgi:hypothetical protein
MEKAENCSFAGFFWCKSVFSVVLLGCEGTGDNAEEDCGAGVGGGEVWVGGNPALSAD